MTWGKGGANYLHLVTLKRLSQPVIPAKAGTQTSRYDYDRDMIIYSRKNVRTAASLATLPVKDMEKRASL